jgi:hypothetical protein
LQHQSEWPKLEYTCSCENSCRLETFIKKYFSAVAMRDIKSCQLIFGAGKATAKSDLAEPGSLFLPVNLSLSFLKPLLFPASRQTAKIQGIQAGRWR